MSYRGAREEKDRAGGSEACGMVAGLVQAAFTLRIEKNKEIRSAAPAAAVPIRKGFLRFDIGRGGLVSELGLVMLVGSFLWARHGRQGRYTGSTGRRIDCGHIDSGRAFQVAILGRNPIPPPP